MLTCCLCLRSADKALFACWKAFLQLLLRGGSNLKVTRQCVSYTPFPQPPPHLLFPVWSLVLYDLCSPLSAGICTVTSSNVVVCMCMCRKCTLMVISNERGCPVLGNNTALLEKKNTHFNLHCSCLFQFYIFFCFWGITLLSHLFQNDRAILPLNKDMSKRCQLNIFV